MRTQFKSDLKEAHLLEELLDTEVYPQIFANFDRKHDKKSQFAGVDIICDGTAIDEKAQIAYKNISLPTQALEISFLSKAGNDIRKRGWFIDNKLETQMYAFVFLPEVENVEKRWDKLKDIRDVKRLEVLFVNKEELQEAVAARCELIELARSAHKMRKGLLPSVHYENGLKLMLSERLAEKPVNVVFRKKDFPVTIKATWDRESGLEIEEDNRI